MVQVAAGMVGGEIEVIIPPDGTPGGQPARSRGGNYAVRKRGKGRAWLWKHWYWWS
jgi:hypothetical protein